VAPIWTHGEFLRFITVKPGSITIWEVRFTSMHTLAKVELLSAPDDIGALYNALFLPHLFRLAFVCERDTLAVWDAQDSKFLLSSPISGHLSGMSFSSDGHFFVYASYNQQAYLFKESSTGYVLCQTVTCGANRLTGSGILGRSIRPLFSPNGESIIISNHQDIKLWHTTDPITSLSNIQAQPAVKPRFLLGFSPGGSIVAFARLEDHIVTVLNLKSGNPQLIIDTGVGVSGLRATGNAIVVVVVSRKIITWNLPTGDHVLNARVTINNSVKTVTFRHPPQDYGYLQSVVISPAFNYIAILWGHFSPDSFDNGLDIYDMSTGNHLTYTTTKSNQGLWITPNGCEVWAVRDRPVEGWKIIKDERFNVTGLEHLPKNTHPLEGYPWESSHGHNVTGDGWILNSRGEQLMWLPHHWRGDKWDQMWDGHFFALLNYELPEPIIIDL